NVGVPHLDRGDACQFVTDTDEHAMPEKSPRREPVRVISGHDRDALADIVIRLPWVVDLYQGDRFWPQHRRLHGRDVGHAVHEPADRADSRVLGIGPGRQRKEELLTNTDAAIRRAAPVGPAVAVFHEPREGSLPDVLERHRITSETRPDRGRTRRGRTRGPRLSTPPSGRRRTRRGPHPGAW